MKIARFEKRIFAYLIDLIIPTICGITLPVLLWYFFPNLFTAWYFLALIGIGTEFLLYTIINTFLLGITNGLTIGNKIMKTRTIHENGDKIKFREAFVKSLCLGFWIYPIVNVIFMLNIHTEMTGPDLMTNTINIEEIE